MTDRDQLLTVAALMDTDPELAERLHRVIVNAWPHLTNLRRAELIDLALTEEFRAVIAAEVITRGLPND